MATPSDVHPEVLNILEHLVNHSPVSPVERRHYLERLDGLRNPDEKAAKEAEREKARQDAIRKQIEDLQAQLPAQDNAPASSSSKSSKAASAG